MAIDEKLETALAILRGETMRKLTPDEIARLEELHRESVEFRERWEAKMQRWKEREERRRRLLRRLLRFGLP
jgi:hypothetical protein